MNIHNPFNDSLFGISLQIIGALFGCGLGMVLFVARKNLKAGLTGELGKRLVGWALIAPLFLVAIIFSGIVGAILLLFFLIRISSEYIRVVGVERLYAFFVYALIPITLLVAHFAPWLYFALPAGSILFLTLVPILSGRVDNVYQQLSFAGRGYLYLVWTTGHLILLQQLAGDGLLVLTAVSVALSDTMQFFVGKWMGKHIISPEVNPRKAWEGLIGDMMGAGVGVVLFSFGLPTQFALVEKIALICLIAIGAAWGDFISSLVKRAAYTKDWGNLIPGHGGLLDRANSLLVVIPLVYYFAYLVMEVKK